MNWQQGINPATHAIFFIYRIFFIYDKSNFEKKHNIFKRHLHKMIKGISHDLFGTEKEKEVCNFLSTHFNH